MPTNDVPLPRRRRRPSTTRPSALAETTHYVKNCSRADLDFIAQSLPYNRILECKAVLTYAALRLRARRNALACALVCCLALSVINPLTALPGAKAEDLPVGPGEHLYPESEERASREDRTIEAYDCSRPKDADYYQMVEGPTCTFQAGQEVKSKEPRTYLLLQKDPFIRTTVKKCEVFLSSIRQQCGTHSSLKPMDLGYSTVRERFTVPDSVCQKWHAKRKLNRLRDLDDWLQGVRWSAIFTPWDKSNRRIVFDLKMGSNFLKFEGPGHSTVSGNTAVCAVWGDTYKIQRPLGMADAVGGHIGRTMNNMGINFLEVILSEIPAEIKDGQVTLLSGVRLHCKADSQKCETDSDGTYLWDRPTTADSCPLYQARFLDGVDIQRKDGKIIFMSTDGNRVRLEHYQELTRCGGRVISTNYPDLFLTNDLSHDLFRRSLHPEALSIYTFSSMGDDHLHNNHMEAVQKEVNRLAERDCEHRDMEDGHARMREALTEGPMPIGTYLPYFPGSFLVQAGDVWRQVSCKKILVRARSARHCYDGLPIELNRVDHLRATHSEQELKENPENRTKPIDFFLEPRTHRIVSTSIRMPCTNLVRPMFQSIGSPGVFLSPKPRVEAIHPGHEFYPKVTRPSFSAVPSADEWDQFDFASSGIYTAADISANQEHQLVHKRTEKIATQFRRGGENEVYQYAEGDTGGWGGLEAHAMFPDLAGLTPSILYVFSWFTGWYGIYYKTCVILLGTLCLYQLVAQVIEMVVRCFLGRKLGFGGCCIFVGGLCPGGFLLSNWMKQKGISFGFAKKRDADREGQDRLDPLSQPVNPEAVNRQLEDIEESPPPHPRARG